MTRQEIIEQLSEHFSIKELVCPHTYKKHKEASWQFLDTNYLHALLVIRVDILKAPMVCNAGNNTQRGLRCNMCDLVKDKRSNYLSAHILGKAGDFSVKGMTAEEAREKIKMYEYLLPCPIRLEDGVTWLHIDTLPQWGVTRKVYEFKV